MSIIIFHVLTEIKVGSRVLIHNIFYTSVMQVIKEKTKTLQKQSQQKRQSQKISLLEFSYKQIMQPEIKQSDCK